MSSTAFSYPVKLETDEDGRVLATFPDFPYGATDGANDGEALDEARDLLRELLAGAIRDGEDIPTPSSARGRHMVTPPALIAAKAAMAIALRDSKISQRALARQLNINENEVRRILNPDHATKISRIEEALAAFGQRLEVRVLG